MKNYVVKSDPEGEDFNELATLLGSEILAKIYSTKGIHSVKDLNNYRNIEGSLLPVDELHDLKSFAVIIRKHYEKKSKIAIYGDYDADGAVASSILWRFFSKALGLDATIYIPDRHEEGYGLNKPALLDLAENGVGLVVTVDCGIRDAKIIKEVTEETKMDILVTDHHQPGNDFPEVPVVHPLHIKRKSMNPITSGGIVAWKIVRYLEKEYNLGKKYSEDLVDIAGISLITDIMPIIGENKLLLSKAIEKLKRKPNVGIAAIMEHAQVTSEKLASYHLGYVIGPRLNANGRIGDQYASSRLMCTDKKDFAYSLAEKIHEVNVRRQDLTKDMLSRAEVSKSILKEKLIVVAEDNFDDGIIGLVAGRLMNSYDLPAIVMSIDKSKKLVKGSARSFGEFNITEFLSKLSDILDRYGGHHNAAGFSLSLDNFDKFNEEMKNLLASEYKSYNPVLEKEVVSYVSAKDFSDSFFQGLKDLEPFGFKNESPLFALIGNIMQFDYIGAEGRHVKYLIQTGSGSVTVLDFNGVEAAVGINQGDKRVFYGNPKQDEFRGQTQITFITEFHEEWNK